MLFKNIPTKNLGKEINAVKTDDSEINAIHEKKKRKCFNCGKLGHLAKVCRSKRKDQRRSDKSFTLLELLSPLIGAPREDR